MSRVWPCALVLLATVALAEGDERDEDAVRLTYTGRVVDGEGKPVEGAVVYADNGAPYQSIVSTEPVPWRKLVPDPLAAADVGPWTVRGERPTDTEGRFEVAGVRPPAGGWVRVVHPAFLAAQVGADPARLRDTVLDMGEVRLARGAALVARVLGPDGKPVEGAWVAVQPAPPPPGTWPDRDRLAPGEARASRTGADGTCRVEGLRPGAYLAAALAAGSPPATRTVDVPAKDDAPVVFRVSAGATLRVEVRERGTDRPLGGARVDLHDVPDRFAHHSAAYMIARAGADGAASFDGLEAGREFRVVVVPPDYAEVTHSTPPPFSVDRSGSRPRRGLPGTSPRVRPSSATCASSENGARKTTRVPYSHRMRTHTLAVAALAFAVAAAPVPAAWADEPAKEAAKAGTVQWIDGWAAGCAVAKERGKLMLVYVHRVRPG